MRLVLADDSLLVREGLARLLEQLGHHVLEQTGSPERLLAYVAHHHPQAVLVDIKMPPTYTDEGLRIASAIRKQHRDVGVLVLSQYVVASYATTLLDVVPTHSGYLLKDRVLSASVLDDALTRIAAGETLIDPEIVRILMDPLPRSGPVSTLSAREQDILALLAEGLSDRGIASRLYISENTVGTHVQRIFAKLKLPDSSHDNRRVHAVLRWLEGLPHDALTCTGRHSRCIRDRRGTTGSTQLT